MPRIQQVTSPVRDGVQVQQALDRSAATLGVHHDLVDRSPS